MGSTKGSQAARWSKSLKTPPSADWGLQLDPMKLESLVIVDQHVTVNTFSGLVLTARHVKGVGNTRSPSPRDEGRAGDRDEVVTRHP